MRVLITGGAGFIGSNFVRRTLKGKYSAISSVTVLDSLTYAGNLENLREVKDSPNLDFVQGSINNRVLLSRLANEVDAVINFAAESHVDRSISDASMFLETNVNGVFEILESIRNRDIRLLQVSTDEVYGSIKNGSWDEQSPLQPNSPYSASKASAELLCRAYHQTFHTNVVVTRCSNNYGFFHHPEKFIPKTITNLLQGKKVPIYGNGENSRDWIHVDDHCDGIYAALIKGKSGETYNFGGDNEISNIALAQLILDAMGKTQNELQFVSDRPGHDFRYSVDTGKSSQELNFKAKTKFNESILDVIKWYQDNEEWWKPLV